MSRAVIAILLIGISMATAGISAEYEKSKKTDPGKLCAQVIKRFPASLDGIKNLDTVLDEKVRPDQDYCYTDLAQCEIRDLALPGLEVSLLVKKAYNAASVLTLTISNPKWKTLQPLAVGTKIAVAEDYLGVKANAASAVLKVIGECTPLDIHHKNGQITRLRLDCQACN